MKRTSLLPGFRFHPTDVELVQYYLKRKNMGKRLRFEAIGVIDLYKFDPWDLPAKSCLQSRDLEWYFFCPRKRKYSKGLRTNRATENGFWKTTGRDRCISYNSQTVGMIKTLVFHKGRPPKGCKTNWVMHEYRLEDENRVAAPVIQDEYVLCKIFEKSGPGPKNGEQYGAPYREEDWEDDDISNSLASSSVPDPGSSSLALAEEHTPLREDNDIVSPLAVFDKDDGDLISNPNNGNESMDKSNVDENSHLDGYAIYNGLEDLGSPSDLKTSGLHSHRNMEPEYALDSTLLEDVTSFLELKDLDYPLDGTAENDGYITLDDLCAGSNDFNNLEGFCDPVCLLDAGLLASGLSVSQPLYRKGSRVEDQLPMLPKDKGFEGDASHGDKTAMCNLAACSGGKAEEGGIKNFQQALARGSFHYSRWHHNTITTPDCDSVSCCTFGST
ncbi:hypothetical protein NE237_018846 [Protea cynaroides]|uniref:NAC domain-containing protein n=1 Tax=Protea cynaroides TaxID=273540 RepID=A0A9Q0KAR2_9MAGN|nr:hypothetical protein NE237_018846 [Protea cynaroides]